MKKIALLLLVTIVPLSAEDDLLPKPLLASRTSMFIHPIFQNIAMDKSLWHTALFHKEHKTAFQVTGFYQEAFRTEHIDQFFLPANRTQLYVNSTTLNRDVNPLWIGLPENFEGYLNIAPSYHSCGFRVEARHMIGDLFNLPFLKNVWFAMSMPFTVNKQNLNLTQSAVQNAGSTDNAVYDIVTAFDNPAWNFDKIQHRPAKKALAEFRFGYGTTIYSNGRAHAVTFTSISVPTHKKPTNEYLFDTQIGNDGHLGVMWGLSLQLPINRESDSYQVNLHIDLENTYLMKNHRYRTFDLKGKEWSRFLLFRSKLEPLNVTIPGVNVMTQRVMVAPHSTTDFAFGIRTSCNGIEGEVGYGIWAHGGDKVRFTEQFEEIYGIAGSAPLKSASTSTIATVAADDATFTPIQLSDFNLHSGSMPAVMVHRAYGTLGYAHRGEKYDVLFGGGFFAEAPHQKSKAFMIWGTHFKAGLGF